MAKGTHTMRPGRSTRHSGRSFVNVARHVALRRQAHSGPLGLAEAREQQRENESWARQSGARDVLAQPPFDVEQGGGKMPAAAEGNMLDSLDVYLQARRWHHPEGPARRFLSHLLTYPLTLAAGLHGAGLEGGPVATVTVSTPSAKQNEGVPSRVVDSREGRGCSRPGIDESDGSGGGSGSSSSSSSSSSCRRLAVVCLGARAESSMPPAFWRETLFALPGVSHLNLHLIGPEVSLPSGLAAGELRHRRHRRQRATHEKAGDGVGTLALESLPATATAAVSVGARTLDISWTRATLGRSAGARAEGALTETSVVKEGLGPGTNSEADADADADAEDAADAAETAVSAADAFVLFNPGLGHPHLRDGWDGALKRLLATGKPIVVSCHSRKDLDRDARLLREAGAVSWGYPTREGTEAGGDGRGGRGRRGRGGREGGGGEDDRFISTRENPFRSLMVSEDPLSPTGARELVSCNWGMMIVRGVGGGNEGVGGDSSVRPGGKRCRDDRCGGL